MGGAGDVLEAERPHVGRLVVAGAAGEPLAVVGDLPVDEGQPLRDRVDREEVHHRGEGGGGAVLVDRDQLDVVEELPLDQAAVRSPGEEAGVLGGGEAAVVDHLEVAHLEIVGRHVEPEEPGLAAGAVDHRHVVGVEGRIGAVAVAVPADQHGGIAGITPGAQLAAAGRHAVETGDAAEGRADQVFVGAGAAEAEDVLGAVGGPVDPIRIGVVDAAARRAGRAAAGIVGARAAVDVDQVLGHAVAVRIGGRAVADLAVRGFAEDAVAVEVEAAAARLVALLGRRGERGGQGEAEQEGAGGGEKTRRNHRARASRHIHLHSFKGPRTAPHGGRWADRAQSPRSLAARRLWTRRPTG
jgi:hypothetical protein